jgi:hypothetical protein
MQAFERDHALQAQIPRPVYLPHPTGAENREDLVARIHDLAGKMDRSSWSNMPRRLAAQAPITRPGLRIAIGLRRWRAAGVRLSASYGIVVHANHDGLRT